MACIPKTLSLFHAREIIQLHRAVVYRNCRTFHAISRRRSVPESGRAQEIVDARVAVLYQAVDAPTINGVRKPLKPLGYQDSGADIAYTLREKCKVGVITPTVSPSTSKDIGWCFPDTEDGILSALGSGATHLWANTILFSSHPLQTSPHLRQYQSQVRVVGQPPNLVEKFDDKEYLNNLLRLKTDLPMPKSWTVSTEQDISTFIAESNLPFPIVGKPIRGRGSHGVRVCQTPDVLYQHMVNLFKESPIIMLEEFLAGEEATVTVMPPSAGMSDYWAMPVVTRFGHEDNIAPYNGVVAVTKNSRAITAEEAQKNATYNTAAQECEIVARLLNATAPIRIDIRRFANDKQSKFALFDINMKPNMTGPGRPGRENQASLTALVAGGLGWDYPTLLRNILGTASTLEELRAWYPKIQ